MIFIVMKLIITESKLERLVIKWLNDNYGDLEPFETEDYPDYIFYRRGDKIIFEYCTENGHIFFDYDEFWIQLESYFGFNYNQIQNLTKKWVEERYNLSVTKTSIPKTSPVAKWQYITN